MKLRSLIAALALIAGTSAILVETASAQEPRRPLANLGQTLQPSAQQIPGEAEQIRMVNETIDIFLEAVKARSMRGLHEHASQNIKSQFTLERLDQSFAAFFQIPVSGKPLANLSPIFSGPAESVGPSAFKVTGLYPTTPSNVTFDVTYIREGTGWKWIGLNVRIAPPGQTGS